MVKNNMLAKGKDVNPKIWNKINVRRPKKLIRESKGVRGEV